MIINELKVIKLFCELDDFTQQFNKKFYTHLLGQKSPQSFHKPEIDISEMMCIEILYHHSGYKCFQYYYQQEVEKGYLKILFSGCSQLQPVCSIETTHVVVFNFLFEYLLILKHFGKTTICEISLFEIIFSTRNHLQVYSLL